IPAATRVRIPFRRAIVSSCHAGSGALSRRDRRLAALFAAQLEELAALPERIAEAGRHPGCRPGTEKHEQYQGQGSLPFTAEVEAHCHRRRVLERKAEQHHEREDAQRPREVAHQASPTGRMDEKRRHPLARVPPAVAMQRCRTAYWLLKST